MKIESRIIRMSINFFIFSMYLRIKRVMMIKKLLYIIKFSGILENIQVIKPAMKRSKQKLITN